MDIKERMANVGMTQVDMILELQKRGYAVQPPMMSSILRGVYTYPKAKQILAVCEVIYLYFRQVHSFSRSLRISSQDP